MALKLPSAPSPAAAAARWRDRDHTRGSLLLSLAVLALPMLATSLVGGVLFQIVDLKLISGLGEDATTAVVVTNQSVRQLVFMLVMGASFGSQGLISRSIGRGVSEEADHVAGQTLLMGGLLAAVVATVGLLFAPQLLGIMNVSPEALEVGVPYLRLVFVLSFGFIFINLFNAILGGAGDTATPFLISALQTFVALTAEWALIYGHLGLPALGIRGVALGLATGHLVSLTLSGRVLLGGASRVHVRARHLRPDPAAMRRILALAWPPALQMLSGFLVTVFFIRLMGDFGAKAQAAYAIGLRLGMIGPIICFPLAGAVATLVGQALGAGRKRRAWRALGVGLGVHAGLMWSLGVCFFMWRSELVGFFSSDPEVVAIGSRLLAWQAGSFAMLGLYFVFFRALQGAGDVVVPMALSLATSLGVSLPLGIVLSKPLGFGPDGIFIASFTSSVLVTLATGAWIATGRWTRVRPGRPIALPEASA